MDKLFDSKKTYIAYDGEEYLNLSIPVLDIDDLKIYSSTKLTQDDNGRLDKMVWKSVAKDISDIDIVMYANHIFNPFAVKEGDTILIPADNDRVYKKPEEPSLPNGSKHSTNSTGEKEMTYAEKIAYLAKKGLGVK